MIKVLLDENLPAPLKWDFSKIIHVITVYDMKWQSKQNGELLQSIDEEAIDYLITADRNLKYQQNLDLYNLRLIVLITHDNRYKTLKAKAPLIEEAILNNEINKQKIIQIDIR